ncbi:hypothetical protein APR41_11560 [Salegentibacter salinarum]|uniref:Uncharacterized protein n=1 Tax=Salegentibacter salinarum TaxID=447422 RepID=A0A2N0TME8_9FLAO|nr:hypothetical protein APR41_11560 [Salegentibacter salinarum]SKB71706.1 hypothetical protein SAMN05660903_02196 [Salegentibacter salinarum]
MVLFWKHQRILLVFGLNLNIWVVQQVLEHFEETVTIQRKCIELNRKIHIKIFKNSFLNQGNDYERTFTFLDVIEDCQEAIDECISIPDENITQRTSLYI